MCGRFTHLYTWKELHRLLGLTTSVDEPLEFGPSYNAAPTQTVPVVRQDDRGNRTAGVLRWGLVPFWAQDPGMGNRLIIARSEEAAAKPAFRAAAERRRCLVPVSGFYEWQALAGQRAKQPWYVTAKDQPVLALAGLWERWSKDGRSLDSFAILTGKPNDLLAAIHDRMPVILRPGDYDRWLDPDVRGLAQLADAMEPFPADQMLARRVGARVNSPANNDPGLVRPVTAADGLWGSGADSSPSATCP